MLTRRARISQAFLIAAFLLTVISLPPSIRAESRNVSYQLLDHPDSSTHYRLNVAVSQTLYEFYQQESHKLNTNSDFAKFVTPYALKPIADSLRQIYTDDEDFANAALMIVHQIPYETSVPAEYPVETLAENKGDCDLFSYVAASIVKAGGLDVALLYYEDQAHMNIGVNLSHTPNDVRSEEYYIMSSGIRFYVGECTGGNWQNGWRIGECPQDLKQATAEVIALGGEEETVGQVSASLQDLAVSAMSLSIAPTFLIQEGLISASGQLSPISQNETITIYVRVNAMQWRVLGTTTTDSSGRFTYTWNAETAGIYDIRANWSGNEDLAGADSPTRTVTILSTFFVVLISIIIVLVVMGATMFLLSRRNMQTLQEPQPPEIPQ